MFHSLQRRFDAGTGNINGMDRIEMGPVDHDSIAAFVTVTFDLLQPLTYHLHENIGVIRAFCRDEHGDDHPGDGGMQSRVGNHVPEDHSHHQIAQRVSDPEPVHRKQHTTDSDATKQIAEVDLGCIEQGDDQDGAEIVGDGKGREKYPDTERDAPSQGGENGQRKGDIGGNWDPPSRHRVSAAVEPPIDQCRNEHTADGGSDWQGRSSGVGKGPDQHFPFDL